jgi:hypothetical protein
VAAQVVQCILDVAGGQRADPAQVLGQDQLRLQVGQRAGVQGVQVRADCGLRTDVAVDLAGGSSRECPARRPRRSCPGGLAGAHRTRTSRRPGPPRDRARTRSRLRKEARRPGAPDQDRHSLVRHPAAGSGSVPGSCLSGAGRLGVAIRAVRKSSSNSTVPVTPTGGRHYALEEVRQFLDVLQFP